MLIQLPVETWIEILDWLRRRDLVKKLDRLWDRQFTPIVQDWLHKYTRNVKIGKLRTDTEGVHNDKLEELPFAKVELPENIASFERIVISYMDTTVLAFLRRLRPIFHNICLRIYCREDDLQTQIALRPLLPMFSSIESLALYCNLLQFFSTEYPSTLSDAKLLSICGFDIVEDVPILTNWLFTPRRDGQPRTLVLYGYEDYDDFFEKIRERFLDPTRQSAASPFFIRMTLCRYDRNLLPNASVTGNVRTGEQLTVNGDFPSVLISNCALNNADPEWLSKQEEEVHKWDVDNQQQTIWLYSLELGPLPVDDN